MADLANDIEFIMLLRFQTCLCCVIELLYTAFRFSVCLSDTIYTDQYGLVCIDHLTVFHNSSLENDILSYVPIAQPAAVLSTSSKCCVVQIGTLILNPISCINKHQQKQEFQHHTNVILRTS